MRNPLERLDDPANYQSAQVSVDSTADPEEPPAIYKVFSRWIGFGNRDAAVRLNALLLSRYARPPRRFAYRLFRDSPAPELGRGSQIEHYSIQDETGARTVRPVQVVSAEPDTTGTDFVVEEMIFLPNDDLGDSQVIVIDSDAQNVNLRTLYDTLYGEPVGGGSVLCIIQAGVTIGSANPDLPAFDVGDWPSVSIDINNAGAIRGAGGIGGQGGLVLDVNGQPGGAGGVALYTRVAIDLDNAPGTIAGGGGGGGGAKNLVGFASAGGGGGAGRLPGPGGGFFGPGSSGTELAGGAGGSNASRTAGNGGAPGQDGDPSLPDGGAGGAAGAAVDGDSFVTYIASGTILGPQVN